ncbi:MAG: hypothetical protein QXD13_01725 [Candidatus Pacearchaeota archaeon]
MDDSKKEQIRKEAQEILKKFAASLEKVKFKEKEVKQEVGGFRKEGAGTKGSEDFRKRMFENAPNKDEDCIIAEKKEWE